MSKTMAMSAVNLCMKQQASKTRFYLRDIDKDNTPSQGVFLNYWVGVYGHFDNWQKHIRNEMSKEVEASVIVQKENVDTYAKYLHKKIPAFTLDEITKALESNL